MASDDDVEKNIIHDHNLAHSHSHYMTNVNMGHSHHIPGNHSTIQNMGVINATKGEFDTIRISGNLQVEGKIKSKQFELDETQIILNIDYDRIMEYIKTMDSLELKVFMKHLEKLKLMSEKELFDRS
jgi:hypothetical protein